MRRPSKKSRPKSKVRRTRRKIAPKAEPDPLDDFIAACARTLDLKVDKTWLPAVRAHLAVTLRLGAVVVQFPLPDDAELAPVFDA